MKKREKSCHKNKYKESSWLNNFFNLRHAKKLLKVGPE